MQAVYNEYKYILCYFKIDESKFNKMHLNGSIANKCILFHKQNEKKKTIEKESHRIVFGNIKPRAILPKKKKIEEKNCL